MVFRPSEGYASDGGARADESPDRLELRDPVCPYPEDDCRQRGIKGRDALRRRAGRAGLPILFRGETTDHAVGRGTLKAWIRDRALRWFYRRCDGLLYVGKQSYEHFLRLGCAEHKLFFSPYCVDTQVFRCDEGDRTALRQVTRQRLGVLDSQRLLLFSGKLSPRKGPELL